MGRGMENESKGYVGEWRIRARDGEGSGELEQGMGRGVENESEGWIGEWRMRARDGSGE